MPRPQRTISSRLPLAVLLSLAVGFSGCGGNGEGPKISLAPPSEGTIIVKPRDVKPITAMTEGVAPQVTWTATCLKDKEHCQQTLQSATGNDNFFTAPDMLGEQVTVRATVKDKSGREAS